MLSSKQKEILSELPAKTNDDRLFKMKMFEMMSNLRAPPDGGSSEAHVTETKTLHQQETDIDDETLRNIVRVIPDGTVEYEQSTSKTTTRSRQQTQEHKIEFDYKQISGAVTKELDAYGDKLNQYCASQSTVKLACMEWSNPLTKRLQFRRIREIVLNPNNPIPVGYNNDLSLQTIVQQRVFESLRKPHLSDTLLPTLDHIRDYQRVQLPSGRHLKTFVCVFEVDNSEAVAEVPEVLMRHFPAYKDSIDSFMNVVVHPTKVKRVARNLKRVERMRDDMDECPSDDEEDGQNDCPGHYIDDACIFPPSQ
jgi:hypothetical protein